MSQIEAKTALSGPTDRDEPEDAQGGRPGTNGGVGGPSGGLSMTSGLPLKTLAITSFVIMATISVNIGSILIENPESRRGFAVWEPYLWEISSGLVSIALAPLVYRLYRLWPLTTEALAQRLILHFAATVPFSLLHVGGMVALRYGVYALSDLSYHYAHRGLALQLIYEWRKDVLGYAFMVAIFWAMERAGRGVAHQRNPAPPQPSGPLVLEVPDKDRVLFLQATDIAWIQAAGNYVEIVTATRSHLLRATLAQMEERLARADFRRIHRSRLVNAGWIVARAQTPSGDFVLTLKDGREVQGSRRYRDGAGAMI